MCARVGDEQTPLTQLIASVAYAPASGEFEMPDQKIDSLRTLAHNCPACILAALRQCSEPEDGIFLTAHGWNWKAEREAWLEDYRSSCFGNESADMVFDRDEWVERRVRRYPSVSPSPK